MGIKNFHTFLRKKIPKVYKSKSLSELSGKKFAIDTSIFMCRFKNIYGDNWLEGFYTLVKILLNYNINFIFVFDSKAPPEKDEEREQRSIARQKNKERIDKILTEWENFLEKNTNTSYSLDEFKEYTELYIFLEKKGDELTKDLILSYLVRLQKNLISISYEDFLLLRKFLQLMNISSYDADSEAEGTCSLMARKGLVDGVLTEDTDVMAYGSPYMYFGINLNTETINELCLDEVLEHLEITFQNLQDFCIMCGTDYNTNMKKIGPIKSFDLVQKYGSLENISKEYDTTILNYNRVRELFECDKYELKINSINEKDDINISSVPLQEFCFYHNIPMEKKEEKSLLLKNIST